jgi:hypothetical protein
MESWFISKTSTPILALSFNSCGYCLWLIEVEVNLRPTVSPVTITPRKFNEISGFSGRSAIGYGKFCVCISTRPPLATDPEMYCVSCEVRTEFIYVM